jgi:putative membrane protein
MELMKRYRNLVRIVLVCLPTLLLAQSNDPASSTPQSGAAQHDHSSQSSMKSGMGNEQGAQKLSPSDEKFMTEAAQGGLAEVELGKLATEKGSSDQVKKFGQRMVDDHSKANDELKQLASSKGVNLPDQPKAKDKATKERLSKLNGAEFDRAYMQDMVKDHKKDVAEFNKESNSAKDSDVKQFASKTLPTLKDHLQQAQQIAPSGKSDSSKTSASNSDNPR